MITLTVGDPRLGRVTETEVIKPAQYIDGTPFLSLSLGSQIYLEDGYFVCVPTGQSSAAYEVEVEI